MNVSIPVRTNNATYVRAVRTRLRRRPRNTSPPSLLALPTGSGAVSAPRRSSSRANMAPKKIGRVATASMVSRNKRPNSPAAAYTASSSSDGSGAADRPANSGGIFDLRTEAMKNYK